MFQPAEIFRGAASEPDAIDCMCVAYELVCTSLHDDEQRRPEIVSQVSARRVLRVTGSGERDPSAIAQKVLKACECVILPAEVEKRCLADLEFGRA